MNMGQMNMRFHGEVPRRRGRGWAELRDALESAWQLAVGLPRVANVAAISVEEVMDDLSYGRD